MTAVWLLPECTLLNHKLGLFVFVNFIVQTSVHTFGLTHKYNKL